MSDTTNKTWNGDEQLALDIWKYHEGIGGADKDNMIKIVSWLMTFSTAIIGAYATNKLVPNCVNKRINL